MSDDRDSMPHFECRFYIPEEIPEGNRMIIRSLDIARQEIGHTHEMASEARSVAKEAKAQCDKFNKIYYGGIGIIFAVELYFRLFK